MIYKMGRAFLFRFERFPSIEASLKILQEWGYTPAFVIDIGAYHGTWTKMFKELFPDASILMLEAQKAKESMLRDVADKYSDVSYDIALLGANDGDVVSFVEMETGSSVFEEDSSYEREYVKKQLVELDSLLKSHADFQQADFLKLDVQGYELEVLRGASSLLKSVEFVYMEVSLIPINKGCPDIHDVIVFMREHGFYLLDFCSQTRRKDKALWQTDLMFISNTSAFRPKPTL
jgi:FkbM family methyltransferase